MPPVSFRTKLLLALMGVVIAVTATMLILTHGTVASGYERLLRSEFERQLDYHLALQAERLQDLKELGTELASWAQTASEADTNFIRSLRPTLPEPAAAPALGRNRFREVPPILSTNSHFLELLRRVSIDTGRGGGFRGFGGQGGQGGPGGAGGPGGTGNAGDPNAPGGPDSRGGPGRPGGPADATAPPESGGSFGPDNFGPGGGRRSGSTGATGQARSGRFGRGQGFTGPGFGGFGNGGGFGGLMPFQGLRLRRGGFVGVLDADAGQVLLLPPDKARTIASSDASIVQERTGFFRSLLGVSEAQQIGCAPLPANTNGPAFDNLDLLHPTLHRERGEGTVLYEIVFNRVLGGPATNQVVGAFVVGVPVPDLLQRPPTRSSQAPTNAPVPPFLSGMWVGDDFYVDPDDVPAPLATAVSHEMQARLEKTAPRAESDFVIKAEGRPYWVFARMLNPESHFPPAYHVCIYALDQATTDWSRLRWWIVTAGCIALLVALLLSTFLAHTLSVPLRELVAGTTRILGGDFQVRVPVRSQDELGRLAGSFNEMAAGLVQKERYRTVLNMVADTNVAQRLIDGGLSLGGEERQVTVLFCDIRGFTAYTQHMTPKEVIDMLNEHMTALTRVVKAHDGVLDKFVGDLLMALFGAPLAHENDALNAARCALALVAERARLNRTSAHQLAIGLGLATGRVVAGCMGSSERLNYTVLGERVNLASRLTDVAAPGEVLIDDATRQLLGDHITVEAKEAVQLKGFAGPMTVWRLVEVRSPGR